MDCMLASTGSEILPITLASLLLVGAGVTAVVLSRRRRTPATSRHRAAALVLIGFAAAGGLTLNDTVSAQAAETCPSSSDPASAPAPTGTAEAPPAPAEAATPTPSVSPESTTATFVDGAITANYVFEMALRTAIVAAHSRTHDPVSAIA
jgi:hypothetical protein